MRSNKAIIIIVMLALVGCGQAQEVVVPDDGVEGPRAPGHLPPDASEAHQPQALACQLVGARPETELEPFAGSKAGIGAQQLAVDCQYEEQRVLGHANGRTFGTERHGNAGGPRGIHIRAVVANPLVLDQADGKLTAGANAALHPRTALGTDREGQNLWMVVVDGPQPGYSEGMTTAELGGLILNRRDMPDEIERVTDFAQEMDTVILGVIPRDRTIHAFEEKGQTIVEGDPSLPTSARFFDLARTLAAFARKRDAA